MIDTRSRVLAIIGCLALLALIVDLVRRRRLKEEYSVLWIATAIALLVMAAWFELLDGLTDLIGGVAPSSTLFFIALLFVFVMLLHFSVRTSALERRLTALVQEIGLLIAAQRSGLETLKPARLEAAAESGAEPAAPPAARIAVVIPCYNDGALATEAVASVVEEEPIDVVVVDDGSTDPATAQELARLEQQGVRVVRRENGGLGRARATGLAATTAPLVYPLDADDRLEPGALGAMAAALDAAPDAAFAWGDYILFGDYDGRYRSPDRWLPWTLTYVNPYPVCSMFRREALERAGNWLGRPVGGVDARDIHGYEDWDLWLRLAGLGLHGVRVDRPVYRRRLHGDSRLLAHARARHQAMYENLQRRNPGVFENRDALRRSERPAVWKPLVYPVLFGARKVVPLRVEAFLQRTMMRLGLGLPG